MIFERFGGATEAAREHVMTLETGKQEREIDVVDVGGAALAR